ncbi:MAG: cytochrome ubiquinol oxidase subunit I [Nitrososphaerota archaeon]|nr:cytochrome ubiquinol oxidase subunit I [Nitrososphaerota archaeon]MDG6922439.1 cytochrome ubiquinol oxidase subunit I [Nitrososphaerota archaeon]
MSATVALFGNMVAFDRFLFAFTIASHITLVTVSIALVVTIVIAEFLSIYKGDKYFATLARKLTKVFAISFGIGTASGIVMAVELVTLFPGFMTVGAQTGVIELFYFEVLAFFLETLFLVLYIYYANAFRGRWTHFIVGCLVAAGTLMSAVLIVAVNAWMNTANGLDVSALQAGIQSGEFTVTGVNPWAPFFTPSTFAEIFHVLVTTVFTGAMIIGGYFAYRLIRYKLPEEKNLLTKGLRLTWIISIVALILAGISGSHEMATVLQHQPLKYAAFDNNPIPGTNLPEDFFGIVIPGLQGMLASFETGISQLPGLSQFPQSNWPPLYIHTTFDLMVLGAFLALGYFALYVFGWLLKKKPFDSRVLLYLQIPAAIGTYLVYQFGWITDEVGRQPWIVYNVVTVAQAANQSTSLLVPGILVMVFYFIVVPVTFYFFIRVFNQGEHGEQIESSPRLSETGGINY